MVTIACGVGNIWCLSKHRSAAPKPHVLCQVRALPRPPCATCHACRAGVGRPGSPVDYKKNGLTRGTETEHPLLQLVKI